MRPSSKQRGDARSGEPAGRRLWKRPSCLGLFVPWNPECPLWKEDFLPLNNDALRETRVLPVSAPWGNSCWL